MKGMQFLIISENFIKTQRLLTLKSFQTELKLYGIFQLITIVMQNIGNSPTQRTQNNAIWW